MPVPRKYRFILPRKLAESLYQVHNRASQAILREFEPQPHTLNLVHKCIRPESILLFEPVPGDTPETTYPRVLGKPFLTDWQHVRKAFQVSMRSGYEDWTMSLYQHPERQAPPGSVAESKYNIGHDIYNLGVCLLEIGLWQSFVVWGDAGPELSPLLEEAKTRWINQVGIAAQSMTESQIEQSVFVELAGARLAYAMGEAYSKLVIKCLTCIEQGFGNVLKFVDSSSRDWDEQGNLFIQEIRRALAEASTMGSGIYNTLS